MITLYCRPGSVECRRLREALEELVIDHRVIWLESAEEVDDLPAKTELPAMIDDARLFVGTEQIQAHLEELESFAAQWRKFQSDACYCDDEGNVL